MSLRAMSRWGVRLSLRTQTRLLFVLPLCALVVLQLAVSHYDAKGARYADEIEALQAWHGTTVELYQELLAAESAVRGYRLAGAVDQTYLRSYFNALRTSPELVREMKREAAEVPHFAERMQHLERLVKQRLESLTLLRRLPLELPPGNDAVAAQVQQGQRVSQAFATEIRHFLDERARLERLHQSSLGAVADMERLLRTAVPALLLMMFLLMHWMTNKVLRTVDVVGANMLHVVDGEPIEPLPENAAEARRLNAALGRAAALLRRREEEGAAARRAAERANAAKTAFLSRMSHELRTPLTAVLGFAELLEMDDLSDEQRDSVRHIRTAGAHLLALINEVLDISRIESGHLAVSIEPIEIGSVANDALSLIRPMAEERGVRLPRTCGEGMFVRADRQRLSQVLLNLLSNAVKYNREFGEIRFSCSQVDGWITLAVTDTGMGIAPELAPRVFSPFDRLGAETTGVEGTGVGLVLSKGLVEAMGGTLTFDSQVGVGTTFTVVLPSTAALSPPEPEGGMSHAAGYAGAEPLKVLYVEDNAANLALVARFVSQLPHVELITTMQGGLATELARLHRPDVVLLDLHLPDVDGETVLRRLREEPETADLRVVMLTADATPGQERRLRALGADDYLTKPLDFSRLASLLHPAVPA